ncbi:S41 family peptidase [Bacillus sp. 2205SS5-2]|uniref:lmo1851 family serine protease n=1 Tax=Bacillus sp. 2205SS5-2 TaxID=3109031 RepID=UPI003006A0DA
MKVVKGLDQENNEVTSEEQNSSSYFKIGKFRFLMLLFVLVFATAAITTFALAFGDEKAVDVGVPEPLTGEKRAEFEKLFEAYDKLNEQYYTDIETETLINGAINGMVESLDDPYSDYMSVEEAEQFNQVISSSFEGIGAEIQSKNGFITVVSPIKGAPAEKAGLKPNDQILAVDGESVQGFSTTDAVMLIRGEKGTEVVLTIQRPGNSEALDVSITRDEIPIESVTAEMKENGVALIQIKSFSDKTYSELTSALETMKDKGMKGMVIDLRQNPGGLLDQAIQISNLFVPKGEKIVQIEDREGNRQPVLAEGGEKIDIPVSVLINEGSASASEILAAAINETIDIPLIGEKSFGKGTVQSAQPFEDGSNIKMTTSKWLTPDGNWIHTKGIEPTHVVKLPEYSSLPYIEPTNEWKENDVSDQIKAAEEMLKLLGYAPGEIDGMLDKEAIEALKEYQSSEKLEVTGILTGDTTVSLMQKIQEKLIVEDPQLQKAIDVLGL